MTEHTSLEHLFLAAAVAAVALFPVVNPLAVIPAFLGLTEGEGSNERRAQSIKAAAATAAILVAFVVLGRLLLDLFDISLAAIEFVGGLIVGYFGWVMVMRPESLATTGEREDSKHIYLTPLAFPLLAGPGALGVALGLENRADSNYDFVGYAIGIIVVAAACHLTLGHAGRVMERLGHSGIDVLNRALGLVVLAIAAELVFHGIADHFEIATSD